MFRQNDAPKGQLVKNPSSLSSRSEIDRYYHCQHVP